MNGGNVYYEWPTGSHGWNIPELVELWKFCRRLGIAVFKTYVSGCRYGMKNDQGEYLDKTLDDLDDGPRVRRQGDLPVRREPPARQHSGLEDGEGNRLLSSEDEPDSREDLQGAAEPERGSCEVVQGAADDLR